MEPIATAFLLCVWFLLPYVLIRLITAHEYDAGKSDSIDAVPRLRQGERRKRSREAFREFDSYCRSYEALDESKRQVMWPAVIVQLAGSYLAGEDCGFALHDALLEAGRPELAEAFNGPDRSARLAIVRQIVDNSAH